MRTMTSVLGLALALSLPASADPYPVITSVNVVITGPANATYLIQQEIIDLPGSSYVPPPGWYVGIGHRHNAGGSCTSVGGCANLVNVGEQTTDGVKSMSQLAVAAYNAGAGRLVELRHFGSPNGGECVGYFASSGSSSDPSSWAGAMVPAASCYEIPGANEWCDLITSSVVIDHGVISVQNTTATGDQSMGATVRCTAPMNIRLKFGQDVLELGGGVQSRLSTTPAAQGSKVEFPAGDTLIQVNSHLTVPPMVDAGSLSASTVLTVEYL